MGDREHSGNARWYQHKSQEEAAVLRARTKGLIAAHKNDDDLAALLAGELTSGDTTEARAVTRRKANRQLYALLVNQIANDDLVQYLHTHHDDDGAGAMKHIEDAWMAGTDENKLEAYDGEYKTIERDGIPENVPVEEALAVLTKLTNVHSILKKSNVYKLSLIHI